MKREDKKFLKELQYEMLTQDTYGQANPRFWTVIEDVKQYNEEDAFGIDIYNKYVGDIVFSGNLSDLPEWLMEEELDIKKCKYKDEKIIIEDDGSLIHNYFELELLLDKKKPNNYEVYKFNYVQQIVPNTMFFTLRECKEHISRNKYHYNNPLPYAMTAWRSPQVSKLYDILLNTNWENI